MEKIIEEKMQKQQSEEYYDAFDYMLISAKENGNELSMQELKVNNCIFLFNHSVFFGHMHIQSHICNCIVKLIWRFIAY